jgi:hypothetical protein
MRVKKEARKPQGEERNRTEVTVIQFFLIVDVVFGEFVEVSQRDPGSKLVSIPSNFVGRVFTIQINLNHLTIRQTKKAREEREGQRRGNREVKRKDQPWHHRAVSVLDLS